MQDIKDQVFKSNLSLIFYKEQKCPDLFSFDGKTLSKIRNDGYWDHFFFFEEVPLDKQFIFKVKIVKAKNKEICIGVSDYKKQKYQQYSWSSNNAVTFHPRGYKHPGNINEGIGAEVGQTVEVRVDRPSKTIRWVV